MLDDKHLMESVIVEESLNPRAVSLGEYKRKRPTSVSRGSRRQTRRKTSVQKYVADEGVFASTALKEIDDLIKEATAEVKCAEDRRLRLTRLRTSIVNHGVLEAKVTKEWEKSA